MLGEVVGCDEGEDVRFEALDIRVVEQFEGRVLDGAVHAFGLAVGPRMIRLGEPVLDAVLDADPVENVQAEKSTAGAAAVFGQVGEGHSVVGQHRVDLVGEGRRDVAQKSRALYLAGAVVELDIGELRHAINGQEHDQLAVRMTQFAAVDVDIADRVCANRPRFVIVSLVGSRETPWRSRQRCRLDRVSFGMLSRRHPMTSSSGSSVRCRNATIMASSTGVSTVLRRWRGPIGASPVPQREHHFATVARLNP